MGGSIPYKTPPAFNLEMIPRFVRRIAGALRDADHDPIKLLSATQEVNALAPHLLAAIRPHPSLKLLPTL